MRSMWPAIVAAAFNASAASADNPAIELEKMDIDARYAMEACAGGISLYRDEASYGFAASGIEDLELYQAYTGCLQEVFDLNAEQLEQACTAGWRFERSGELSTGIDDQGRPFIRGPFSAGTISRVVDIVRATPSDAEEVIATYHSCLEPD